MAAPVVQGTPAITGVTTAGDPVLLTLPPTENGELAVLFIRVMAADFDGTETPGGWNYVDLAGTGTWAGNATYQPDGSDDRIAILWKLCNGFEPGSLSVNLTATSKAVSNCYRITGHDTSSPIVFSTVAVGTDAAPNPGSLDMGASGDYLFFVWASMDGEANTAVSTWPTNYTSGQGQGYSGSGGATATNGRSATAYRTATTQTEDPSAFAVTAVNSGWTAYTVGIKPASGGTNYSRTPSDVITLADSASKASDYGRGPGDVLSLSDALSRAAGFGRSVTDALTLADLISAGKILERLLEDDLGLSDSMSRLRDVTRTASDAEGLSDAMSRLRDVAVSVSDVESLADTMTRAAILKSAWTAIVSETTGSNLGVSLGDQSGLGDVLGREHGMGRLFGDIDVLADLIAIAQAYNRAASDVEGLSDVIAKVVEYGRLNPDVIGLSDLMEALKSGDNERTFSDLETLSDSLGRILDAARNLSDVLGLSDVSLVEQAFARAIGDMLALTSTHVSTATYGRTLSDTETLADLIDAILTGGGGEAFTRLFSDPGTTTYEELYDYRYDLGDVEGESDSMAKSWSFVRARNDVESLSDGLEVAGQYGPAGGPQPIRDGTALQTVTDPGGGVRITAASNFQSLIDSNPAGTLFVVEANETLYRTSVLNLTNKTPTIIMLPGSRMVGNATNTGGISTAEGYGFTLKGGKFENFGTGAKIDSRHPATPNAHAINTHGAGLIEDVEITTSTIGLALHHSGAGQLVARRCKIHGNYCYGITGGAPGTNDILIENIEVTNNNTALFDNGYDAGGSKFVTGVSQTGTGGIVVRESWWHANKGSGLWFDYWRANSALPAVYDNVFEDNDRWGFFWEVSWCLDFHNNFLKDNEKLATIASSSVTSCDGAAGGSQGVNVHHNEFDITPQGSVGTRRLFYIRDDGRGIARNVNVHDNRFWLRNTPVAEGGQVGLSGIDRIYTEPTIDFDNNVYKITVPPSTNLWRFGISPGAINWAAWQAAGFDPNGTTEVIT